MIKIGIDVHGVLDTAPHFFAKLSRLLVQNGHEVHILTGAEKTETLEKYLKETLGLSWTHFFSVTSFHKEAGTEITYIYGNPYMDNQIWNRAKSKYCIENSIQLHIDDSDTYGKHFTTPYAKFEYRRPIGFDKDSEATEPGIVIDASELKKLNYSNELKDDLSNYNENDYKRPSVTVDVAICTIIEEKLKVLLIKRKYPPFRNCWAIPGGFLDIDLKESLEEAAARELEEETGLKNLYIEQLNTYGEVNRDPRTRIITTAYFTLIPYSILEWQKIRSASDASATRWFTLNDYERELADNNEKLAFDHNKILEDLKTRLCRKISYSPIAFKLLPATFTWTELRKVYETILNKTIDPANFKKKIKTMYKISELKLKKSSTVAGRPPVQLNFDGVKGDFLHNE